MSLFEKLKDDRLTARKLRQDQTISLLATVIGEVDTKVHQGNKLTDEMVVAVLKKFNEGCQEIIGANRDQESVRKAIFDSGIIEKYLPQQLTEDQLKDLMVDFTTLGDFQKYLKQNFAGKYDGGLASKLFNGRGK